VIALDCSCRDFRVQQDLWLLDPLFMFFSRKCIIHVLLAWFIIVQSIEVVQVLGWVSSFRCQIGWLNSVLIELTLDTDCQVCVFVYVTSVWFIKFGDFETWCL
jgi:hypothetical protein